MGLDPQAYSCRTGYLQARCGQLMDISQEDEVTQEDAEMTSQGSDSPQTLQSFTSNSAYKQILTGLSALLIFSAIVLLPHIISLYLITFGGDNESSNNDWEQQPLEPSCDSSNTFYDEERCEDIFRNGLILQFSMTVIFYSVPVFGLAQIYLGVKRLMTLRAPDFENIINNTLVQKTDELDNTPHRNFGKSAELYIGRINGKLSKIDNGLQNIPDRFKFIAALLLLIGATVIYL